MRKRISYSPGEALVAITLGPLMVFIGGFILDRWHGVLVMALIQVQLAIIGFLFANAHAHLLRWRRRRAPDSFLALPPERAPEACSICGVEGDPSSLVLCETHGFDVQNFCEDLRRYARQPPTTPANLPANMTPAPISVAYLIAAIDTGSLQVVEVFIASSEARNLSLRGGQHLATIGYEYGPNFHEASATLNKAIMGMPWYSWVLPLMRPERTFKGA